MQLVPDPLDRRGVGVDDDLVAGAHRLHLGGRFDYHLAEIQRLARQHPADVAAGQQQKIGHQTAHPLRGAQGRAGRLPLVACEGVGEQLEVREDAG